MRFLLFVPAYGWLLISTACFACGEYLSKKWGMSPSWKMTLAVLLPYMLGTLAWLPSLLHKNSLSVMGIAWSLMSVMATLGIAFFIFNEKLSALNAAGLVLALAALVLLQI